MTLPSLSGKICDRHLSLAKIDFCGITPRHLYEWYCFLFMYTMHELVLEVSKLQHQETNVTSFVLEDADKRRDDVELSL